ncbi:MAG: hypothetical protein IT450_07115 [Phycisphaerales bacterium]|nr:hypothetical protein [Phycisphaerales bacterium]
MEYTGNLYHWDDGINVKTVVLIEGPSPASHFGLFATPTRPDRYALIAVLASGATHLVHCDDLVPARTPHQPATLNIQPAI